MKRRQDLEIKEQVIGELELHEEWTENEARETEGFVIGDAVRSRPRLDSFPPATDKQVSGLKSHLIFYKSHLIFYKSHLI